MGTHTMVDTVNKFTKGEGVELFIEEHYEKLRTLVHSLNKESVDSNMIESFDVNGNSISVQFSQKCGMDVSNLKETILSTQKELESFVEEFTVNGDDSCVNISLERREEEYY